MIIVLPALLLAVADQWTKEAVRLRFALGESRPVWEGVLHLTYVRNTGAAWGLFGGYNQWLILFSAAMLVFMVWFRHSIHGGRAISRLALGMMLGGIVGNLMDRVRFGYVVDFVDVHFRGRHFPAFNVADAAITLGVGLYLISSLLDERRMRRAAHAAQDGAGADQTAAGNRGA